MQDCSGLEEVIEVMVKKKFVRNLELLHLVQVTWIRIRPQGTPGELWALPALLIC